MFIPLTLPQEPKRFRTIFFGVFFNLKSRHVAELVRVQVGVRIFFFFGFNGALIYVKIFISSSFNKHLAAFLFLRSGYLDQWVGIGLFPMLLMRITAKSTQYSFHMSIY